MCSFSRKIKLLKIWIYSEFRVGGRPKGGYPQGGRQASLGVAARGHRAAGETGCYPYENVTCTPMATLTTSRADWRATDTQAGNCLIERSNVEIDRQQSLSKVQLEAIISESGVNNNGYNHISSSKTIDSKNWVNKELLLFSLFDNICCKKHREVTVQSKAFLINEFPIKREDVERLDK